MTAPAASQPDGTLLARARAGDVRAFDELYRRHRADARRVARTVADDHEEAEALVAAAFDRLVLLLREGRGVGGALTTYLRTTIRRLAADQHRVGSPADPAMLAVLPSPDHEVITLAERQLVREAFETIPERWQRALWFTEIEGRRYESLAPSLGSTPDAVAALTHRAREGLRQAYLAVALSAAVPAACGPYMPKLASHVHGTLPDTVDAAVVDHLGQCVHCRMRRDELLMLVSNVRAALAPALVGPLLAVDGAAYLAGGASRAVGGDVPREPRRSRAVRVAATTLVSAAAAVAVAFAAVSAMSPQEPTDPPAAAAPAAPADISTQASTTPTGGESPSADATPTPEPAPEITEPFDTPSPVPSSPVAAEAEEVTAPEPEQEPEPVSGPEGAVEETATTVEPEPVRPTRTSRTAPEPTQQTAQEPPHQQDEASAKEVGTSTPRAEQGRESERRSGSGARGERGVEGVCQLLERLDVGLPPFCR